MHRVDLTSLVPVAEAHYTDLYGNAVRRFHEKYKNADPHIYYVNFNPVVSDPRDKTMVGQQSDSNIKANIRFGRQEISKADRDSPIYKSPAGAHGDPVGTYGYPIDYVTKHWFDLTYGKDMTNLRVLKAVTSPDKVLKLTNMTKDYFLEVMKRLNLEFHVKNDGWYYTRLPKDAIMIYEAIFESDAPSLAHFRVNSYGKTIFRLIQNDFTFKLNQEEDEEDEGEEDDGIDNGYSDRGDFKYEGYLLVDGEKQISAQKQSERARKAGFDAILDRADSRLEAAIHPNEPEQIIFLTKRAYEVDDTFKMPNMEETSGQSMPSREDEGRLIQKAAGVVAKTMGDTIAGLAWRRGFCPIKNLSMFRHWLATEEIAKLPADDMDPTVTGAGSRVDGWFTSKGRLIVVTPAVVGKGDVEDSTAAEPSENAASSARIRPGEDRDVITGKLDFERHREMESHHRAKLDYNAMSFDIGIVSEKPAPAFIQTEVHETMDAIGKQVSAAMAQSSQVVTPAALTTGDLSAKRRFRHITAAVIDEYVRELKKRQVNPPVADNYAYKNSDAGEVEQGAKPTPVLGQPD